MLHHGIHNRQEFAHTSDEPDLASFAGITQASVEGFLITGYVCWRESSHVESGADRSAPAPDGAAAFELTAVASRRQPLLDLHAFPQGNIQVKVTHDSQRANTTAISVGYNIFNPTSNVNVGELLKNYGGGGHKVVGSSRVPNDRAEQAIKEILDAVTEKAIATVLRVKSFEN